MAPSGADQVAELFAGIALDEIADAPRTCGKGGSARIAGKAAAKRRHGFPFPRPWCRVVDT